MLTSLKNCRSAAIALVALLLGNAPAAQAQRLADLPSGTRLRVRTDSYGRWHNGTFAGVRSDSLAFQENAQLFVVPRDQIQALEWRDRDASRWPRAFTGAGIGAIVLGTAIAISASRDEKSCKERHGDLCGFGALLIIPGAGVGALLGAGVGALLPVERWHTVDPPLP